MDYFMAPQVTTRTIVNSRACLSVRTTLNYRLNKLDSIRITGPPPPHMTTDLVVLAPRLTLLSCIYASPPSRMNSVHHNTNTTLQGRRSECIYKVYFHCWTQQIVHKLEL